jgi:hypothetical protein
MSYSNEFFRVEDAELSELEDAFPGVPIEVEFGKMRMWLLANPARRKKRYSRFIVNWLSNTHRQLLSAQVHGTAIALARDVQRRTDANVGRGPRG